MSGETAARDKNIIARLQGLTAALCTPLDEQFNLDRIVSELQGADLIAHQSNQRRYHHRHPVAQKCRHLETKRFTTTRGHDGQCVFAGGNGLYDLLLAGAEPVKSKDITK